MKKTVFLLSVVLALIISGCNQKHLVGQIDGNWHVQKYAVSGMDKTRWFDSVYTGFTWRFAGSSVFSKHWTTVTLYTINSYDTVGHYDASHNFILDSVVTTQAVVPTTIDNYRNGDWYLTNGNQYIETRDSIDGNIQYQIVDHSNSSLHLLKGNIDYYLAD
jgi:hypothetical protein